MINASQLARLLSVVTLGMLLGGCGGGLRSRSAPIVAYVLHAPEAEGSSTDAAAKSGKPLVYALTVLTPIAQAGLADDGIALITSDSRLDRYAASRWPASVPKLVSALAVRTLRNSGLIANVSDDTALLAADYVLRIDVSNFEAHYRGERANGAEAPSVAVRFDCAVARRSDRTVIGSFVAQGTDTASNNRMGAVISAFDRASQAALRQMRHSTLEILAAQATTP